MPPRNIDDQQPEDDIPMARGLSHNEQFLVDGGVLAMASSNVEEMWWDVTKEDLYVRFKGNGAVYRYRGVSLDVAVAFVESDSPGRFVWSHLRDKYPYERVGTMEPRPKPNVVRLINK